MRVEIRQIDEKFLELKKNIRLMFNNCGNLLLFKNQIFVTVNVPTHICPTRNWQQFLILTHWSYCNWKDVLHTVNVYNISAKEHQVVDCWDADEISVLEILFWKYLEYVALILRNYKKLSTTKSFKFTISSFLNAQLFLVTAAQ